MLVFDSVGSGRRWLSWAQLKSHSDFAMVKFCPRWAPRETMWSVAEWQRSWGWVCELFELDSAQLYERLTVTMRSSRWVWWRAWPPKPPLSCEIKGNGEKDFLWFSTSFVQNYFCGNPVAKKLPSLNPNPALPVREEEAKRRWRRTLRYRSVTISPEKNSIHSEKLSLCILSNLSPSSYFSLCAEACDLYDEGQFNGNCLQI